MFSFIFYCEIIMTSSLSLSIMIHNHYNPAIASDTIVRFPLFPAPADYHWQILFTKTNFETTLENGKIEVMRVSLGLNKYCGLFYDSLPHTLAISLSVEGYVWK